MKTHAVPQEIMSVEFKLFGNFLSLREFIFIAVGLAVAWFIYFLMNKGVIPPLLGWPAVLVIGGGGTVIGLVPFQDRPIDQWITNYFAAIKRPTQRVWKKEGFMPTETPTGTPVIRKDHVIAPPTQASTTVMQGAPQQILQVDEKSLDENEEQSLSQIEATIQAIEKGKGAKPVQTQAQTQTAKPTSEAKQPAAKQPAAQQPATKSTNVATTPHSKTQSISPKISTPKAIPMSRKAKTQAPPVSTTPTAPEKKEKPKSSLLQKIGLAKAAAPQQQSQTQQNPAVQPGNPQQPQRAGQQLPQPAPQQQPQKPSQQPAQQSPVKQQAQQPQPPKQPEPNTKQQPVQQPPKQAPPAPGVQQQPDQKQKTQEDNGKFLTITDQNIDEFKTEFTGIDIQPNTINIVVKDQANQSIPQVTCIVKNSQGDPVRAAISNPLGQIINNIPLNNGTYLIQLSKNGYVFPEVTRVLTGKMYPAIEIKSL